MLAFAAFFAIFPDSPAFFIVGPLGYLLAHAMIGVSLWREASAGRRASATLAGRAA